MPRFGTIVATGRYLPEIEISNDLLRERFQATAPDFVDKMEASSGIRKRWYAPDGWATSDVALPAARQALERAGRKPEEVDLIILGTDSPDYITPSTSVVLQGKLGAVNAGTFDVGCACASFPTGLAAAAGFIAANPVMKTILVVGVYLIHKLADPSDPMIFFYGDGAGAAVVEALHDEHDLTVADTARKAKCSTLVVLATLWAYGVFGPASALLWQEWTSPLRHDPRAIGIVVGAYCAGALVMFPILALIAATVSYLHMHELVEAPGQPAHLLEVLADDQDALPGVLLDEGLGHPVLGGVLRGDAVGVLAAGEHHPGLQVVAALDADLEALGGGHEALLLQF